MGVVVCNTALDCLAELDVIEAMLAQNAHHAPTALHAMFGEIPRVVQGVRV